MLKHMWSLGTQSLFHKGIHSMTQQNYVHEDVGEDLPDDAPALNDLRLEMKVKNNVLWKKIHEKFPSVSAFCRAHPEMNLSQAHIGRLLAFKTSPFRYKWAEKRKGRRRRVCLKEYSRPCLALEKALKTPAEELFPEELYQKMLGMQTSKAVEISSFGALPAPDRQKLLFLSAPDPSPLTRAEFEELRERIDEVLHTLTLRQRQIIEMRYGILDGKSYTYDELSEFFKITRERVRQIELWVLRKLREPMRANRLESFV
ncbi:MAG: sigma-70 family RNA polymerase sigma factor [bacterium]|nr:sigma-70 family RNA polymerase sigma factor [bacterium]